MCISSMAIRARETARERSGDDRKCTRVQVGSGNCKVGFAFMVREPSVLDVCGVLALL